MECRLQWCGSWDYSAIALTRKFLSYSIRARHYAALVGNWTSFDPLWPSEMAYGYVENRVMKGVDYWGMSITDVNCNKGKLIDSTCAKMVDCFASPKCKSDFKKCVGGGRDIQVLIDAILSNLNDLCGGNFGPPTPGINTCIVCHSKLSKEIRDKCSCSGIEAATLRPFISGIVPSQGIPDDQNNGQTIPSSADARPSAYQPCYLSLLSSGLLNGKRCDAVVLNCNDRDVPMAGTLLHELVHVLGVGAGMGHGKKKSEFVDRIDRCLRSVVLKK
jgi:hypothetical protein